MAPSATILVVANRTAGAPELISALRERAADSAARFTLLVPATPRGLAWAADMKAGEPAARSRAARAARRMRVAGLELESTLVGDPDPAAAVADELSARPYDEIFVSTLPAGISRWLRLSLPQRLRRLTELPVTHVAAGLEPDEEAPARAAIRAGRAGGAIVGARGR